MRGAPKQTMNKIRKVVIAAAGKGTRMLHHAKDKPKHLIEVQDRPFLYYVLHNLKSAGLEEMIIVTGYKKEKMEEFAKTHKDEFNITLINQFEKFGEEKYGTSVPIECAQEIVGNENFIAIYGDNLYSPNDIKKFHKEDDYHYIGVIEHPTPEKYGVAVVGEDDLLLKIVEKPKTFISNLINTGIYKFTPEIFDEVEKLTPSERGEYELTDAVQALVTKKRVRAITLEDYWHDFGNPDDIEKVSKFLRES